jgi:hypothetical protein
MNLDVLVDLSMSNMWIYLYVMSYCDIYDVCDGYCDLYDACDEYYDIYDITVIFGYF